MYRRLVANMKPRTDWTISTVDRLINDVFRRLGESPARFVSTVIPASVNLCIATLCSVVLSGSSERWPQIRVGT